MATSGSGCAASRAGMSLPGDGRTATRLARLPPTSPRSAHTTVLAPRRFAKVWVRATANGVLPTPPFGLATVITEKSGSARVITDSAARSRISGDCAFGARLNPSMALSRPRTPRRAGSPVPGAISGAASPDTGRRGRAGGVRSCPPSRSADTAVRAGVGSVAGRRTGTVGSLPSSWIRTTGVPPAGRRWGRSRVAGSCGGACSWAGRMVWSGSTSSRIGAVSSPPLTATVIVWPLLRASAWACANTAVIRSCSVSPRRSSVAACDGTYAVAWRPPSSMSTVICGADITDSRRPRWCRRAGRAFR